MVNELLMANVGKRNGLWILGGGSLTGLKINPQGVT